MKNRTIRITEAQLRAIINEEIAGLNEISVSHARQAGSVRKFMEHMMGARQALSELYQGISDPTASDQVAALANGLNRLINAGRNMEMELSQDPADAMR